MTFDDWMLTKDCRYYPTDDTVMIRKLHECWDAAQKYGEVDQQLAEREKQILFYRSELEKYRGQLNQFGQHTAADALDATQDLKELGK